MHAEYTIVSIDDSRREKKEAIVKRVGLKRIHIPSVNGREEDLSKYFKYYGVTHDPNYLVKLGELGVWFSQMNCWDYVSQSDKPLVVFEDDAIVHESFNDTLRSVLNDVPDDNWHFVSLFVPDNQRGDYFYKVKYDKNGAPGVRRGIAKFEESQFYIGSQYIALAYQGYSCVATMYSPKGGQRLLERAREMGIYTPVDCFLFLETHKFLVNGLAMQPLLKPMPVAYDWDNSPTLVHNTVVY